MDDATEPRDSARAAAEAIRQLCRATSTRPSMTPATIADILADLAAAAALPQAARQLSAILEQANNKYVLEAAHNETAHVAVSGHTGRPGKPNPPDTAPPVRRPQERQPLMGPGGHTPGPPR